MKKSVFIALAIMVTIVIVLWLFLSPSTLTTAVLEKTPSTLTDTHELSRTIDKQQPLGAITENTPDEEEYNPYESAAFKAQVQTIADQYQDTARFPVNSQPIKNSADARLPEPFEETEVETPFETESGEVIGVSAAVDKFQYFSNDTINVRLSLTDVPEGVFVNANATIAGPNGDTPLSTELQAINANQSMLTGSLDTSLVSQQIFSKEMIVKVSIDIGGEPFFTTVSFSYSDASAQLVGLGVVQPNGANLEIPFEYNVFIDGYYFVSAVLKDQQTGRPLIALQTEGRMSQGNGRLVAKAHIEALVEAGSQGPYILTNIKANRGAEQGEQFDIPASTVRPQFEISAHSFSEYQNETYQDPLAQERVEFLQSLGAIDNSEQSSSDTGGE